MATGNDIIKITAAAAGALVLKPVFSRLYEYDLRNKTVLITGGSRGLGLVLAREFAQQGARLVLCARDEQELEQARIDVEKLANEVMTIRCDVTNKQEVNEMIAAANSRFGSASLTGFVPRELCLRSLGGTSVPLSLLFA